MTPANYLIDTSALARLMRGEESEQGWDRAAAAGLIAVCPIIELEYFFSSRSWKDRQQDEQDMTALFCWVHVDERMFRRAVEVQSALTRNGHHRSAGPVDLLVAATAEFHDLTLLHRDRDFDCIAAVTGQRMEWFGRERST
ncbi:PIN domain nuclease [Glycomyces sp. A-F 0318]|uniref:PIN domain nuclease n=1 Tax=Glycomyces amatae TaxID=2881355 RepID=UPI001E55FBE6|nr:PIN domain nuclease [Glycomyces amatae]